MNPRKLVLLNPYQLPSHSPLTLAAEDMACWLNGYSALWHPAALWRAPGPPTVDVAYDHEQPRADHLYAVPETPPMFLPEDWEQRVRDAGSVAFHATPDRAATLANLREALGAAAAPDDPEAAALAALCDLTAEQAAPFFGVGLGHAVGAALSEAMEHENLLDAERFWEDVQRAVAARAGLPDPVPPPEAAPPAKQSSPAYDEYGEPINPDTSTGPEEGYEPQPWERPPESTGFEEFDGGGPDESAPPEEPPEPPAPEPEPWLRHLQSAAERLLSAREVLYPVPIYLLDICLLEEGPADRPLPPAFEADSPINLVAPGVCLEKLHRERPEVIARLREQIAAEKAEVCGGPYAEREDALLPVESQLWNLLKGQEVARDVLGAEVQVFARRRFGAHPQLPTLLTHAGMTRGLMLTFDDSALPAYQATVVSWPSPDGRQVDCFARKPLAADNPETFFNLAHSLFKTIREDHYATLALVHRAAAANPWYGDWLALSRLAPVLGQWHTFTQFFNAVQPGEYAASLSPDDFHFDHLTERVPLAHGTSDPDTLDGPPRLTPPEGSKVPVSGFARHARLRRRIDTCWTLAALQRGLAGRNDALRIDDALRCLEDQAEAHAPDPPAAADFGERLADLERQVGEALASRLLSRATAEEPGYLILNPCSFTRRVALELDGGAAPLPITDPVKACQLDGDRLRAVVEVPALGFAWIPKSGPKGTAAAPMRIRLADERGLRNEFFEAEIDPQTGGLRGIRDHRTGVNRVAQRLVFNPGSVMRATEVKVTSPGPALGEVVAEGVLLGEQEQVLAKFRQRFRAWLGRPVLEMRIELTPELPAAGYPWHAYYGARFAWRDERGVLLRGVNGMGYISAHVRPQTPDYLELRLARQGTVIFPGGLPFHQRQEGRMLDVILAPGGETGEVFELGLALDREHPMQTALGMITPVPVVATAKGPPHVGSKGWLFHLDAPNLMLTSLRPGGVPQPTDDGEPPRDGVDAITARLVECASYHSHAEFRCARDPRRVVLLDGRGETIMEGHANGDAAVFDVSPGDLVRLQVEFS